MKNTHKNRSKLSCRGIAVLAIFMFLLNIVISPWIGYAQLVSPAGGAPRQTVLGLPVPGTMVTVSPSFHPAMVNGLTIHPEDPFIFDFIVHPGDENLQEEEFKEESTKLIKYFLAALTVPEDDMWVNLSPYEKNRIIPRSFGQTEMGRDLLAQDYLLKQLSASLMYPENALGKEFWGRVRDKAREQFGTTDVSTNVFHKIWIVPEKAAVYEHGNSVLVVGSHLKVLLEEDYRAMTFEQNATARPRASAPGRIESRVMREILIPAIEKEVNEGKTFANLRQIYNAVILATWYKRNLKESLLGQVYANKNKTKGVDVKDQTIIEEIYNQYVGAFKNGVYDFIKEDYDPVTEKVVPRKYFSGGASLRTGTIDRAMLTREDLVQKLSGAERVRVELRSIVPPELEFNPADMALTADYAVFQEAFDVLAAEGGGKIAFSRILDELAESIGFFRPDHEYFFLRDIWHKLLTYPENKKIIDEANAQLREDMDEQDEAKSATIKRIGEIVSNGLIFQEKLVEYIRTRLERMNVGMIIRSSQRREDSFMRNLTNVFTSVRAKTPQEAAYAFQKVLWQAIETIWFKNNKIPIEGLYNFLTPQEGVGLEVDEFIFFDVSGTAVSDRHGHTSVQAGIGDAKVAVQSSHANTVRYLFEKEDPAPRVVPIPSFQVMPFMFILNDREYRADRHYDYDKMRQIVDQHPKINGKVSFLTEEEARELNRVINALERDMPGALFRQAGKAPPEGMDLNVPLDIEWGIKRDGQGFKVYIIQTRPVIGAFTKEAVVKKSAALETRELIAKTPVVRGQTAVEGVTGKVVIFNRSVSRKVIRSFERDHIHGQEYIRLQPDVAEAVLREETRARVLVDPTWGTEEAHYGSQLTNLVDQGRYVYAVGPVLKDDLLKNLHFLPGPRDGIWISEQDVTFFSDGLAAEFYLTDQTDEPEVPLQKRFKVLDELLPELAGKIRTDKSSDPKFAYSVMRAIHSLVAANIPKKARFQYTEKHQQLIETMAACESNCAAYLRNKIDEGAPGFTRETLGSLTYELALLEVLLSNPLYPSAWEKSRIRALNNLLAIRSGLEYFKSLKAVPTRTSQRLDIPETINILIVNDSPVLLQALQFMIASEFEGRKNVHFDFASSYQEANELLGRTSYSIVYFDLLGLGTRDEDKIEFFNQLEQVAYLYVLSDLVESERLSASNARIIPERILSRIRRFVNTIDLASSDRNLIELSIQEAVDVNEKGLIAHYRENPPPRKPEIYKVLLLNDDLRLQEGTVKDIESFLRREFGAADDIEIDFVDSYPAALAKMSKVQYDHVIVDLVIDGSDETDKAHFYQALAGDAVKSVSILSTVAAGYSSFLPAELKGAIESKIKYTWVTTEMTDVDQIAPIASALQAEADANWRVYNQWDALVSTTEEMGKKEDVVFVINNSPSITGLFKDKLEVSLGPERKIVVIHSMRELEHALRKNTPSLVITDAILNGKEVLEEILSLVQQEGSQAARYIVSSKTFLEKDSEHYQARGYDVLKVIATPFHVRATIQFMENLGDHAMTARPGGIDMNPHHLDLERQGQGIEFQVPSDLQQLQNINIEGLSPVIINISPVTNVLLLFGVADNEEKFMELGYHVVVSMGRH